VPAGKAEVSWRRYAEKRFRPDTLEEGFEAIVKKPGSYHVCGHQGRRPLEPQEQESQDHACG